MSQEIQQAMPASIDAERSILGAIVLQNELAMEASTMTTPDDFHLDSHRRIYAAMLGLLAEGAAVDIVTLTEFLGRSKEIEAVGGVSYVSGLTDGLPRRPSIADYCRIVQDKSRRRKLIHACNTGVAAAYDSAETTGECLSIVQEHLLRIESDSNKTTAYHLRDIVPEVMRDLELQAMSDHNLLGMTTGVETLDELTTGIRPGEMWVIGALAGRGKTAFGMQVLGCNVAQGIPCCAFSLEMTRHAVVKRMLAGNSTVSAHRIRRPEYLGREGFAELVRAANKISEWPLWVDDAARLSLSELLARARLYVRRHKVKLVLVDYLRLVHAPGKEVRHQVGAIAEGLREFAKSEQVAVALLSQLSRPKEGGLNARPTMIHLKESGDIEAHAHVVLLMYMPVGETGELTGEDEIIIGKQREGLIGPVPVHFNKSRLQFFPREEQQQI